MRVALPSDPVEWVSCFEFVCCMKEIEEISEMYWFGRKNMEQWVRQKLIVLRQLGMVL
jgi:hypothetical protein